MIRINGTYPSDSITGAGLAATDDSLFIVSLVLPPSVLSQSISKLFRQGNVPAFSQRQKLLQTKKRTSSGMNFSTYSYSKPIQSSSTTEEENQCIKPGQPFCDFGELYDAPRCKGSPEQGCHFLLGIYRPPQLEPKTPTNPAPISPSVKGFSWPPALTDIKQQGKKMQLVFDDRHLHLRHFQTAAFGSLFKLLAWGKAA